MPESRNVKLDALSWQFSTKKEKQDPEPILPATCIIGTITWEIELALREVKSRTGSRRRARRAIFVPSTVHSQPTLSPDAREYVSTCSTCARDKLGNQPRAGLLQPPTRPWFHITVDFAIGLPPSAALPKPTSVLETAQQLTNHVFPLHGIPEDIKRSTPQKEHTSQELKTVLRCIVASNQIIWSEQLPWVEYTHNSLKSSATGRVAGFGGPLGRHCYSTKERNKHANRHKTPTPEYTIGQKTADFCGSTNMDTNDSSLSSTSILTQLPLNTTAFINSTVKSFSVFDGCENLIEAILFDLAMQCINVILGIPANLLVIAILIHNRKEPSTSDIFLGCLAFMDAYFGAMTPLSFLNLYLWQLKEVWSAIKFSFGVKDTSGPLFLSCICLDRFVAVLFPIAFGQLKHFKYRLGLSVLVLCLTFAYSAAKMVGGLPNFEKLFTGEVLAAFTWMVVCNASILWALKKSTGAGKDAMHPMKKKAFKMVLSILCIIVFNYLPLVALFPFEDYYSPHVFRCYVQPAGFAFLNISSTIQPLVYLSRLEKVPFLSDASIKKITSCFNPEKNQNAQEQNPPA
ncbi:uncharacterized protein LOC134626765 [Pelmatolapia mariae]|uniref:uncharacterized protein LOC134626765 n=1 Tax=Pelmatolapia mariae TaxID=158779 RepID=UPI002FE5B36E